MMINYVVKMKEKGQTQYLEYIVSGVENVQETEDEVKAFHPHQGKYTTTIFPKGSQSVIQSMYLNNDEFKTLKRLI